MTFTATYSPDDNKIRLYASERLDKALYDRVRAHGFIWAPKQGLFVAPKWTPNREDLAVELAGELGDEDTTLTDRAEQRAERFEEYREHRTEDAERARESVAAIADNIPLGQPILVGHHSERHARKDAERIENGMRKAVKMWDTAQYWKSRAAGALAHAKYKELPRVRANRIKTLDADKRKQERAKKSAELFTALWNQDRERIEAGVMVLTWERARAIANREPYMGRCFPLADYPRLTPDASTYEGRMSLYSALEGIITPEQARDMATRYHARVIAWADRWLVHLNHRLDYERAMLDEQGATALLAPKPKSAAAQLPLVNYRAPEGLTAPNIYHRHETIHYPQVEMTAKEYTAINRDYKGTRVIDRSHRVRTCMQRHTLVCVFLIDSKVHTRPAPIAPTEPPMPSIEAITAKTEQLRAANDAREAERVESAPFDAIRQGLRAGVQVVSAPQLFPTPEAVARQVLALADIQSGECVLEPSAGTGNLIAPIVADVDTEILAYEINPQLCAALRAKFPSYKVQVRQADFLDVTEFQGCYPKIVMNPPFKDGADITHIQHARKFLAPGGRLVAVCAAGPRQRAAFANETWIDLPAGSFESQGTGVNTAIVVIES